MNQLMMVAVVAGRNKRNDLLNELTARFDSAVSVFPALASLTGFSALTKPDSMKKHATHAGPCPTSRNIGLCINAEPLSSPKFGGTIHRAKQRVR
jgi:hypothetical protein